MDELDMDKLMERIKATAPKRLRECLVDEKTKRKYFTAPEVADDVETVLDKLVTLENELNELKEELW